MRFADILSCPRWSHTTVDGRAECSIADLQPWVVLCVPKSDYNSEILASDTGEDEHAQERP
jgi:hypothetical protein